MPPRPQIPVRRQPVMRRGSQQSLAVAQLLQEGLGLHRQGRISDAKLIYERILQEQYDHFEATQLLATAHCQQNQPELALRYFEQALKLNKSNAVVFNNRGNALRDLRRLDEALESYEEALRIKPDYAEAYNNRGNALRGLKRLDKALKSYDEALRIKPAYAEAYNNRGNALRGLKRLDEALKSYDEALRIKPDYAEAYNSRGNALRDLERLDEALKSYDEALRIKPDYAEVYNNRGPSLRDLKRLDEALKSYDEALRIKPDYADAYFNKSLLLLLLGHFDKGWTLHEWRLLQDDKRVNYYSGPSPAWRGEQDIAGKRLLLQCEQGLGDTIQFMRYLPLVLAHSADVIIETPKRLIPLFLSLNLPVKLIPKGSPLPPFEMHCPLMSLPHVFQTRTETVPNQVPYLAPAEERLSKWRRYIGTNGFKIAICWQGSAKGKIDVGRSFPLHMFEAISKLDGVRLISLQKDDGVEQLRRLPIGMKVEVFPEDFDNGDNAFLDSAAVMRCVDLVITSDTSLTHLAGALGVKTWLLLKHVPDWRWMLDRHDSPWYPNHRLFRQTTRDDWANVFREVEVELELLVANKTHTNSDGYGVAPLVPVSWGELVDKITILEIKKALIESESAQTNIRKELDYLCKALNANSVVSGAIVGLKTRLYNVNKRLWNVEDAIREKDSKQEFDRQFIDLARSVYMLNDERSQIKRSINSNVQSEIVEEKSYKSFSSKDGPI